MDPAMLWILPEQDSTSSPGTHNRRRSAEEDKQDEERVDDLQPNEVSQCSWLSHEMRGALSAMSLAIEHLQRKNGLDPAVRRGMDVIGRNADLLAHLLDDLDNRNSRG